jgi:NADH-quinone oxidoreductase subunit C
MSTRTNHHPALQPLKAKFPDVPLLAGEFRDMVTVVVPREHLVPVCTYLRDDPNLRYDMLAEVKVFLDPSQSTAPKTAVRDEELVEKGDPGLKVPSVCSVWPGAEWLEREVYDMMGIIFVGHPDLRRIMTWNGFGSYPLRKDYPLRGVGEREEFKIVTREGA